MHAVIGDKLQVVGLSPVASILMDPPGRVSLKSGPSPGHDVP